VIEEFMQWLGFGLCHQLPERSFFAGGLQAPVCARDTGLYVGFVVSFAVIGLLHGGRRPRGFPTGAGWVAISLFILLMAWDGVTSYAGLRATTNDLRLITGTTAGFAIGAIVLPMLNDGLWRSPSPERVLAPASKLLIWVAMVPVTYVAVRFVAPVLGVGYSFLVAASIIGTLTAINMVILAMLPPFDRRAESFRDLVPVVLIGVLVAFIEIFLAGRLNAALLALGERFGG
jgi:uncharacterized membrane protein